MRRLILVALIGIVLAGGQLAAGGANDPKPADVPAVGTTSGLDVPAGSVNSIAKSRSETASSELPQTPSKPSVRATRSAP